MEGRPEQVRRVLCRQHPPVPDVVSATPTGGLQAASTHYWLEARDLATGAAAWKINTGTTDLTDNVSFVDGASGVPGHPSDVVVISNNGSAAFDARTGALLWHHRGASLTPVGGDYVTDGVVVNNGYPDNDPGHHITASAATGQPIWKL